jgi:hypothetical protein
LGENLRGLKYLLYDNDRKSWVETEVLVRIKAPVARMAMNTVLDKRGWLLEINYFVQPLDIH